MGPFSHESALARMRAALVLPTPRAPVNRKAWWTRFCAMALVSVRATCSCPISSENFCGRYFRARTRYDTRRIYLIKVGEAPLFRLISPYSSVLVADRGAYL